MALNQSDLEGWEYVLKASENESPRRRSRRSEVNSNPITLTRVCDRLEVKVGDVFTLNDGTHVVIGAIDFGTNEYLTINALQVIHRQLENVVVPATVKIKSINDIATASNAVPTHVGYDDDNHSVAVNWDEQVRVIGQDFHQFLQWSRQALSAVKRGQSTAPSTPRKKRSVRYIESPDEDHDSGEDYKAEEVIESEGSVADEEEVLEEGEIAEEEPAEHNPFVDPPKKTKRMRKLPPPTNDEAMEFMESVLSERNSKRVRNQNSPQKASRTKLDLSLLSPRKKKPVPATLLLDKTSTAFKDLKAKLESRSVFETVVGREDEFMTIMMNISDAIMANQGCCVYVSGTPGTGKTATIRHVVESLQSEAEVDQLPSFDFFEICGLRLISAHYVYEMLWEKISGYKVHPTHASTLLDEYFKQSKAKRPLVVFLDELDSMVSNKQEVLYNLLNWPTYPGSKLIVVAAANTMDLPERLLANKISSRLGLRRLQFPGYTFPQLQDIFRHRLELLAREMSTEDAKVVVQSSGLEFAARKAASIVGDARRALGVARRAVELCYEEMMTKKTGSLQEHPVTIAHVTKAIADYDSASSPQPFLTSLSKAAKLVLRSLLLCMKRSGTGDATLQQVISEMNTIVQMNTGTAPEFREIGVDSNWQQLLFSGGSFYVDRPVGTEIRMHQFNYIINELSECGVVVMDTTGAELYRKIRFNFPKDEIEQAIGGDWNK